jgi:hypothetical protein
VVCRQCKKDGDKDATYRREEPGRVVKLAPEEWCRDNFGRLYCSPKCMDAHARARGQEA